MNTLSLVHLHWAALPTAFFLDLLIGDPPKLPHPVRLMGRAIVWAEPRCRTLIANEFMAGTVFAVSLIVATFVMGWVLCAGAYGLHPIAGFVVETLILFFCLSARSLAGAGLEIHGLLRRGRVGEARTAVSLIVGRDVDRYGADDIARATVETVAENSVDGVLAPLFYALLGGPPLALAYKMVNTLDSMVGYKNERYLRFGRAAARLDDAAGWLPARLSVPIIALAAACMQGLSGRLAWKIALRDGHLHASPNAGRPEAAFAGALERRLNGPNHYHGVLVNKPWLAADFPPVTRPDIIRACRLMLGASTLGALLAVWLRLAWLCW